jgi:NADPH-dependent 2,4-dienoyl-CoA reductase/sulfur reductase-like enzyme
MDYDVLIIGSGPAGQQAAWQAARMGKRAAIIERKPKIGGAGLQTGTIPSKALREVAYLLSRSSAGGMRQAQRIADIVRFLDPLAPRERARILGVIDSPQLQVSLSRPPLTPASMDADNAARAARKFKEADEIRADLLARGIELEDTRDGTRWKVRS